jgi:UDP-N-acetylglucosamine--N-acetylmuramyl-(pentapeptide) pyrophosphoryl-undecaprenol N-acetylglucosamine transferase
MQKPDKINIVLTGGHAATTAIAVIEELLRRGPKEPWSIYWVGASGAVEGKNMPTLESEVLPKMGVTFRLIIAGRLQRRFSLYTIPSLFKIPFGFIHALILICKIKPKLILSFGGFAAFPMVVVGKALGVPVIIHEQTIAAGRANRASAPFARKILLSRKDSQVFFPKGKTILTGNPIMTQIAEIAPKSVPNDPPVIFVTGGSRGSQTVNCAIGEILPKLLLSADVIHQTGPLDFAKFSELKEKLPPELNKRYSVYDRVDPMRIDNLYREADMVVARAGANTVGEIIATKRPAILIPIPWTYLDEQSKNAGFAADFGIAKVLKEEDLSPDTLMTAIKETLRDWKKITTAVSGKLSPDKLASEKVVNELEEALGRAQA